MSRGPGRCQRAVLARLEVSENGGMDLDELVETLEARGYRSQNIYRAVRALRRVHAVGFSEHGPGRGGTRVSLPRLAPDPLSDDEISRLLAQLPGAAS